MLAFLFAKSLAVDEYFICVYNTSESLCPSDTIKFKSIKYTKEMEKFSSSKEINRFDKVNVTLYIPENLSSITVDAYAFKNSFFFRLIGLGSNAACKLVVSQVCTFNIVEFNNAELIKSDTTEIDFAELYLRKILFSGFDKASKFFGGVLDSDLLSTRYITFLFEHVTIHCNETSKFLPNYIVDGAIFAKDITYTSFLQNSSVYQFGDQMIITPVSRNTGFRRTCIRPYTPGINTTVTIKNDNPNSILTIGSWFSSKVALFTPLNIEIYNSTLTILDGNWNNQENFKIKLQNAILNIEIDGHRVSLQPNSMNSIISSTIGSIKFLNLNLDNIDNIKFKDVKRVSVEHLYVSDNSKFGEGVQQLFCKSVHSGSTENVSFTAESDSFITNSVDETIKQITCKELYIPKKQIIDDTSHSGVLYLYHDNERIPTIICQKVVSQDDQLKINVHPNKEDAVLPNISVTLIKSDSTIIAKSIILIWDSKEISDIEVTNSINVKDSDIYNVNQKRNICLSNDETNKCGVETYVQTSSAAKLSELINVLNVSDRARKAIEIDIYLEKDFDNFEIDVGLNFKLIRINSNLNPNNKVTFTVGSKSENSFNIKLEEIYADIPEETKINNLKMKKVKIIRKDVNLSNVNNIELDAETNDNFNYPLHPIYSITIQTETVDFNGENLTPKVFTNFVEEQDMKIIFTGVNKITKSGAPFPGKIEMEIQVPNTIEFTSNNFGSEVTFDLDGIPGQNEDLVINFKAVLPAKIVGRNFSSMTLRPHFLGDTFLYTNQLCGKNITLDTTGIVNISKYTLFCETQSMPRITSTTIAADTMFQGNINLRQLTIERMMGIASNSYVHIDEYANPDDDFLLHYNWSLKQFPTMKISKFVKVQKTAYVPGIQTYAEENNDDRDFMKENMDIFNFGLPFICIDDSNYKGNLFNEGMVFTVNGTRSSLYSRSMKIGPSSSNTQCAYMLPFDPNDDNSDYVKKHPHRGPINKGNFQILIGISFLLLLVLFTLTIYMLFFTRYKSQKKDFSNGETRSALMEDLL